MPSPTTYFEWCGLLERFARGDDAVLSDLEQGSFVVDAGTVYRFYNQVQEAYVERKKQWADKFNRSFQVQAIRTENDIALVLRNAKANLQPIARLIGLAAFPQDLRETLKKDFDGFVTETKKNIRESVRKNHPGNEKILFVVNTFDFFGLRSPDSSPENPGSHSETAPNKRKILF
jgi:hypothetical protein